ncbi:2-oxo acid dehydrogenase subunit E2 [Bradyrhizobium sp. PMVTL-01]|uniref:2-oxo acid dehydrogenase subunit E2 n=1 Tax=Bradyrhizobium sp. PMVTL-01 TaxID=3434999 RepID=UPI003F70DC16
MVRAFTEIPLTPLREVIAARMTQAKQTIPHFRLVANLEIDALLRWRAAINEGNPTGHRDPPIESVSAGVFRRQ